MWPQRGKEGAADRSCGPEGEYWTDVGPDGGQWWVGPDGVWWRWTEMGGKEDGHPVWWTWVPYEEEKPAVAAPPGAGSAQEAASAAEPAAGRAQQAATGIAQRPAVAASPGLGRAQEAAGGRAQQAAAAAAAAAEIGQEAAASAAAAAEIAMEPSFGLGQVAPTQALVPAEPAERMKLCPLRDYIHFGQFAGSYRQHNAALKYFRDEQENPDHPFDSHVLVFPNDAPAAAAAVTWNKGQDWAFDRTKMLWWSWKEMVARLDADSMRIVVRGENGRSCGLLGCYFAPRPNSYDHKRHAKLRHDGGGLCRACACPCGAS